MVVEMAFFDTLRGAQQARNSTTAELARDEPVAKVVKMLERMTFKTKLYARQAKRRSAAIFHATM